MPIRWTSQHGSGGDEDAAPNKLNANFVIQAMFQPNTAQGINTFPIFQFLKSRIHRS